MQSDSIASGRRPANAEESPRSKRKQIVRAAIKVFLKEGYAATTLQKVAEEAKVNVFQRWALMKRWYKDGVPLSEMDDGVDPNLHTGDWATRCISRAFDEAMAGAPPPAA